MTRAGLTRDQAKALQAIRDLTKDGVPPSYEELRSRLGLASRSGAHRVVQHLVERGCIVAVKGKARAIRVVEDEVVPLDDLSLLNERQLLRLGRQVDAALVRLAERSSGVRRLFGVLT